MSRDRGRSRRSRPSASEERRIVSGRRAVAEALRAGLITEVLVAGSARRTQGLRAVLDAAAERGLPVRTVPRDTLDALSDDHQGVVARLRNGPESLSERELAGFPFAPDALVVVLDGITDPQNLGAAARSAEAAGASLLVTRTRRAAEVTPAAQPLARVDDLAAAHDQVEPLLGPREHGWPRGRQRGRLLKEPTARAGAHRRAV